MAKKKVPVASPADSFNAAEDLRRTIRTNLFNAGNMERLGQASAAFSLRSQTSVLERQLDALSKPAKSTPRKPGLK